MPLPPSRYTPGPVSPQQLNTDLYGVPGSPSGVAFHASRPLLSETLFSPGTAYTSLTAQPVTGPGISAYTVIDTTALAGPGADNPGSYGKFTFSNNVLASGGSAGHISGQWLTWGFPYLGAVTAPPGGAGAGMTQNSTFEYMGTFQYGNPLHDNCPWYLDLIVPGAGSVNTWKPSFWWLTPSTPAVQANLGDTSGLTTRMGWLWQSVTTGGSAITAIPQIPPSWGTVTTAMLNSMGTALALLNNPPVLRVSTTSGQALPTATSTLIDFPAPNADNYSGWSTATSTYTAPLPGLYLFSPTLAWGTASQNGDRWAGLYVTAGGTTTSWQGAAYAAAPVGPGTTGTGLTATATARVLSLNAGDTVSAYGFQNSGGTLTLYTGYASRLIGAYLTPRAAAGTTLSWSPPVTGFRFQAGALAGTALAATLASRIGNDVSFLLNRPCFTGYQSSAQSGFATDSGFQKVTIDTLGALPRGGNGDSYGGWSTASSWYTAQVAGWHLVIADLYATAPAATTATLTAGIGCPTSGGIAPQSPPDAYQQVYYPVSTGGPPPGAFAMGLYYLGKGEYVYPLLQAQGWGGTWGTYVAGGTVNAVASQFSVFWVSS